MRSSRRSSVSSAHQVRSNSLRGHGRVTKDDIRSACFRRWDGRARITTDWINLYHEPELCYPTGDLLIYLREPGQSSHGPAFRVHTGQLKERGFDFLLDKCISRPPIHPGTKCLGSSCHGCDRHSPPSELYIPAPANADLDSTFDHHITTRNFFAWLYDLPLAGRALGRSLITLNERIDYYRPNAPGDLSLEVVSYAETQGYLDFRECVDHALAALLLAESLKIEDLWIDAFSHCVGMCHRGLNNSIEFWAISYETKVLINKTRFEMESRIESIRRSVCDFFEHDLSGNLLGLSQAARDHFDCFRSWLHSYHIKQHGFWPPDGFEDEAIEQRIYASMYADFRDLYHHLMDPDSATGITDINLSTSGGICTTQNIQAFDSRNQFASLPKTMPLLPREPDLDTKAPGPQRRRSWNPLARRRIEKDKRKALRIQALIAASNRDWTLMDCSLVRQYSEFESQTVMDDTETLSMIDGRKVRWILIYAILQIIVSVMQTPKQVRNAEGLTYLLCCRPPTLMPWQTNPVPTKAPTLHKRRSIIEPDAQYNHSNSSSNESIISKPSHPLSKQIKEKRRQSLPARVSSSISRPSTARPSSIRRLITRHDPSKDDIPPIPKSSGFCEILVQGYGNGLNEINPVPANETVDSPGADGEETPKARTPVPVTIRIPGPMSKTEPNSASSERMPELTPTSSTSVSRESSNASSNSTWSKGPSTTHSDLDVTTNTPKQANTQTSLPDLSKLKISDISAQELEGRPTSPDLNHVLDEDGLMRTVHFNTKTWDEFLGVVA